MARILIVDDEVTFLSLINMLLENSGHEIVCAQRSERAISLLEKDHFDVVVADVEMGDTSGIQLLSHIRTQHKEIPVVMMATRAREDIAEAALHAGACDYILKPFAPEQVVEKLNGALRSADSRHARSVHDPRGT